MESAKEASLLILLRKRNGIRAGWERGYRAGLVKYRGTETRHRARLPEVTAQLCGAVLEGAGRKVSGDGLTQAPSVTASACFASQPLASSLGLASLGGKEGGKAAHRGWAGPPTPQPGGRGCCSPPPAVRQLHRWAPSRDFRCSPASKADLFARIQAREVCREGRYELTPMAEGRVLSPRAVLPPCSVPPGALPALGVAASTGARYRRLPSPPASLRDLPESSRCLQAPFSCYF